MMGLRDCFQTQLEPHLRMPSSFKGCGFFNVNTFMMEEQWKDVVGYEGIYRVSNMGRIKSLSRKVDHEYSKKIFIKERILKGWLINSGYFSIGLSKDGYNSKKLIHRIVAEAFITNPENKPEINHKNGIKTDNRVENLEWCSSSHNKLHSFKMGLSPKPKRKGEKNGRSKLTKNDVLQIRSIYPQGWLTQQEIADAYDVTQVHISRILLRKIWTHI